LFQTDFGAFDGTSWERLCQSAFKIKYGDDYQRMPASPGDFGLEGWTSNGLGFQCYCPEKNYTQPELYEAIRDKITADVPKLKLFAEEISARIGSTKLNKWLLVTPVVEHNKLHAHARKKEKEARAWNLPILHKGFSIFLQDAGFYALEFEQCHRSSGRALQFGPAIDSGAVLPQPPEEFDKLIDRKNRIRLRDKAERPSFEAELQAINDLTQGKFLRCDAHLATIERTSPQAYQKIIRVIGHYAEEMKELQYFWTAEPNGLVDAVKSELGRRLEAELGAAIGYSDARNLADLMVSRWLAVCQLDFAE
jgi:hypothetical protein